MSATQGRKIVILGGSGQVGSMVLKHLLEKGIHTITVVTRPESTATFPAGIRVERGLYTDEAFLTSAFAGQEVLVLALSIQAMASQGELIRAAAKAGVKTVLPTEFGSDTAPSRILEETPMIVGKTVPRQLAESLGMKWIAIVNNPWLDWSLAAGNWGIDIKARKATLYDGGRTPFVTTTLNTVGRATAGLLSLPDAELAGYHNGPAYIRSFRTTQRDILSAVQRATGTSDADWDLEVVDAAEAIKRARGAGGQEAFVVPFYAMHMMEGYGGDYEHKVGRNMEKFGAVEEESLDDVAKRVVKEVEAK